MRRVAIKQLAVVRAAIVRAAVVRAAVVRAAVVQVAIRRVYIVPFAPPQGLPNDRARYCKRWHLFSHNNYAYNAMHCVVQIHST
jgi:hypothetical protein